MAVRIRMKRMGRTHRPFFRVCAVDGRRPRDGRVIEELGIYDPMVNETDARAILKGDRIDYWLSVGAQPSEKVRTLIKKYGASGTHLEAQREALARMKVRPTAPPPARVELPKKEEPQAEQATTTSEETSTATASQEEPTKGEEAAPAEAETGTDTEAKSESEEKAGE